MRRARRCTRNSLVHSLGRHDVRASPTGSPLWSQVNASATSAAAACRSVSIISVQFARVLQPPCAHITGRNRSIGAIGLHQTGRRQELDQPYLLVPTSRGPCRSAHRPGLDGLMLLGIRLERAPDAIRRSGRASAEIRRADANVQMSDLHALVAGQPCSPPPLGGTLLGIAASQPRHRPWKHRILDDLH